MKTLDRFGGWLLSSSKGNVFMFAVVLLTVMVVWDVVVGDVVLLSSKNFECAMTMPDGIGSKCIEYHLKRGK